MRIISKFFLLSALVALLFSGIGEICLRDIQIFHAKNQAQLAIWQGRSFTSLSISTIDFKSGKAQWIGSQELRYDGHLYDIAKVEYTSDGYKCQVIKDEKEESLLAQMCEHIEHLIKDHSSSAPPNKGKISFIEKDYFNNDTSIIALAIASIVNDYGLHIASILPSITLAGSSPPPDFSPLLG